ncbi:MAG TPA: hypothetical protein VN748_19645 [Pseudonocardiaceae bacterium]|jgi:hypothetical protein|nr:hypothetical protein [Pseudonocardiaceae bacterium]
MIGCDELGCEAYAVVMRMDRAGLSALPDEQVPARSRVNMVTVGLRAQKAEHA